MGHYYCDIPVRHNINDLKSSSPFLLLSKGESQGAPTRKLEDDDVRFGNFAGGQQAKLNAFSVGAIWTTMRSVHDAKTLGSCYAYL